MTKQEALQKEFLDEQKKLQQRQMEFEREESTKDREFLRMLLMGSKQTNIEATIQPPTDYQPNMTYEHVNAQDVVYENDGDEIIYEEEFIDGS